MADAQYDIIIVPKRKWTNENDDFATWVDDTAADGTYTVTIQTQESGSIHVVLDGQ